MAGARQARSADSRHVPATVVQSEEVRGAEVRGALRVARCTWRMIVPVAMRAAQAESVRLRPYEVAT